MNNRSKVTNLTCFKDNIVESFNLGAQTNAIYTH